MGDDVRSPYTTDPSQLTESASRLLRRELAGGVWRVLARDEEQVMIGLFTCDAREEMERFTSPDERCLLSSTDGAGVRTTPPDAGHRGPG